MTTLSSQNKKKTGIECPTCKERLFSWHRHDFHYCKENHVFIDGGNDYLRFSSTIDGIKPKIIEFDEEQDKAPSSS